MSSSEVYSLLVSFPMSSRTELNLPGDTATTILSMQFSQSIQGMSNEFKIHGWAKQSLNSDEFCYALEKF